MCALAFASEPEVSVSRSELRQKQSRVLRQATGKTVVKVTSGSRKEDDETKYIVDKQYWEEVLGKIQALKDTLAITSDPKLFPQLLRAGETVDEDIRLGKLHSFEEAFAED
jgi:regulator of protease activity HflC (stomatin/prohibitin superfamily)